MSKLRVNCFSISLDGFGAGTTQGRETPLGVRGESLHEWISPTKTFASTHGGTGATTGDDDAHVPTKAATHVVLTRV